MRVHGEATAGCDRGDPVEDVLPRSGVTVRVTAADHPAAGYRAAAAEATRHGMNRDLYLKTLGPFTKPMLVRFGVFPSYRAASVRLSILHSRRERGRPLFDTYGVDRRYRAGRRPEVWCSWEPHAKGIQHELLGTELQLMYPEGEWERGYEFEKPWPDARVYFGDAAFFVEFDNDTEGPKKWRQKVAGYRGVEDGILIVARREGRIRKLIDWSEGWEGAYFATLEDVERDRWGRIWRDVRGGRHKLIRPPGEIPAFIQGGPLRPTRQKPAVPVKPGD
jgi:hypothetical protein